MIASATRRSRGFLRAFGWCLCMLVAVSMAGSRVAGPVTAALASSYTAFLAPETDLDCDGDASHSDDSDRSDDSDSETEEIPTVPDVRFSLARVESSRLTIAYSGKPRPGFWSPEPRPAERI
jgi:hypothetical protein